MRYGIVRSRQERQHAENLRYRALLDRVYYDHGPVRMRRTHPFIINARRSDPMNITISIAQIANGFLVSTSSYPGPYQGESILGGGNLNARHYATFEDMQEALFDLAGDAFNEAQAYEADRKRYMEGGLVAGQKDADPERYPSHRPVGSKLPEEQAAETVRTEQAPESDGIRGFEIGEGFTRTAPPPIGGTDNDDDDTPSGGERAL